MILDIILLDNPLLKKTSALIEEVNEDIEILTQNMLDTMYFNRGIGLAGVQIGVLKQIFVIDIPDVTSKPLVCINPVIKQYSPHKTKEEEGCLSIPNVRYSVKRPIEITLEYIDLDNKKIELTADGLFARCIQHEYDHLKGMLYFDRIVRKNDKNKINQLLKKEMLAEYFKD